MVDLEMGKMLLAWVASGQGRLEAMNVLIQSGSQSTSLNKICLSL